MQRLFKMQERAKNDMLFSVLKGASGSLYVVVGKNKDGLEAVDLEKFATLDESVYTIPWGAPTTEDDQRRSVPGFQRTFEQIVKKYSPEEPRK